MSYDSIELPDTPRSLVFALDYDDCYTEDPSFWTQFLELVRSFGHRAVVITSRLDKNMSDVQYAFRFHNVRIYNTNQKPKLEYARENHIHIDVWIDNDPRTVTGAFT